MGAGNSKNENAKPESCIACDLMDSYVDAVCDAVSEKIIQSNPNEGNDEETIKCSDKLIVDLRKHVREFVNEAKDFQNYYNKKTEELKKSLEKLDKNGVEKIEREIKQKLQSQTKKKIGLQRELEKLGEKGKRDAIQQLRRVLFSGKSVLNNINEKDKECFWCVETVTKMTADLIAWIKNLVAWLWEKVAKTLKWCTLSLGNVGKCILIGAGVAILVIAIICQAKTNYSTVLESEYSKSMGKMENITVLERRSRSWKFGNDVFGLTLTDKLVNWFSGGKFSSPLKLTENVIDIREDNFEGYFWTNVCPYVVYTGRYARNVPILREILYVVDGRFLHDTVGINNDMSWSDVLYNFGYDSSQLLLGLNTQPVMIKYFQWAQTSTNWYHAMHAGTSLLSIGTAYASPAAVINPYAQMAALGGNLYWEMTVGMDMRNYEIAVMERNILRPMLLTGLKKTFQRIDGSEKWINRLDAMAEIVMTGQQVYFMFKGLTNPKQVSMNFVRSAIRLKKMEDMEVKTLGDKAKAKLNEIINSQKKMLENQEQLLEQIEDLNTELKDAHDDIKKASKRAKKFEEELKQLEKENTGKILEELDDDNKQLLSMNEKHQAEVKLELSKLKRDMEHSLKIIADKVKKIEEMQKIQDKLSKDLISKNYILQYIDSLYQFKLEYGKIFTNVGEGKWRLTKDEEILVWVNKRKDERNKIYEEWSALREGNMPEVSEEQRKKILGSFSAGQDRTIYTAELARKELIKTLLNGMSEEDKEYQKRLISIEEYSNIPEFINYYNLKPGPKLKF